MLKEVLTRELVTTCLEGTTKREIIYNLLTLLCRSGKVNDFDKALQDIHDNEARMSTGMENGIAIPHAKSEAVNELTAAVGITRSKINFECLDRKPAQIFVMTLSPKDSAGPHIKFLSEIGKLLRDRKFRKDLITAKTDEELFRILTF